MLQNIKYKLGEGGLGRYERCWKQKKQHSELDIVVARRGKPLFLVVFFKETAAPVCTDFRGIDRGGAS